MKALEMLCYFCAVIGLICTWLGRRMIIMEAMSISNGWVWAMRLLPLADIMFLARFWDSAKGGAMISLTGLLFLLPLGAKTAWESTHPSPVDLAERARGMDGDHKIELYLEMKLEHEARIAAKQQKLQRLNQHMGAWYASMTQRQASLATATPAQLAQFNDEAAAYKSLHEVTKREAAELQKLLDKPFNGWASLSNEDYGRYLHENDQRAARKRTALPALPQQLDE